MCRKFRISPPLLFKGKFEMGLVLTLVGLLGAHCHPRKQVFDIPSLDIVNSSNSIITLVK